MSVGRLARDHDFNSLIAWALVSVGIPVTKEPRGLLHSDGKRPNGLTLIAWQAGKAPLWDVMIICPLAESYVNVAVQGTSTLVELAAAHKTAKYTKLACCYLFHPVVV